MKGLFSFLLVSLFFTACQTTNKSFLANYLNTGNLPQQAFTINPDADTILTSSGGVKIRISKGTFPSGKPVTIEWKEALDFQSMLKAGLTTQTGKELLRSGGMFYFDTKENVKIQKPIGIDVPTENIATGMQLYKGDSSEGKLDWQAPKPIENVKAFGENILGKVLFENNCRSCHRIDEGVIIEGGSLLGVTDRRSRQWLYAVIRNPAAMASFDPILCCQKNKWGVMMTSFPVLTKAELDSIYDYIDYETVQQKANGMPQGFGCDGCAVTDPTYDSLLGIYNQLWEIKYLQRDSLPIGKPDLSVYNQSYNPTKKRPAEVIQGKKYYQVNIQAEGWYNIDALFKEWTNAVPSNLIVYPKGKSNVETEYYLAIPAMKILITGTLQNGGETVVFDEASGQIPLPQQRGAFILAVGGADGKYFFAKKDFTTSTSLIIDLPIQTMSKQQFEAQISELSYIGLKSNPDASINNPFQNVTVVTIDTTITQVSPSEQDNFLNPFSDIERQLKKLTAKKMKDCGCDPPKPDGTSSDIIY